MSQLFNWSTLANNQYVSFYNFWQSPFYKSSLLDETSDQFITMNILSSYGAYNTTLDWSALSASVGGNWDRWIEKDWLTAVIPQYVLQNWNLNSLHPNTTDLTITVNGGTAVYATADSYGTFNLNDGDSVVVTVLSHYGGDGIVGSISSSQHLEWDLPTAYNNYESCSFTYSISWDTMDFMINTDFI